jgi:hypothetical protein
MQTQSESSTAEFDKWLEDALWFSPCPPGFEVGPWREACEEIVLLCGDPIVPIHHERINRLLKECVRIVERKSNGQSKAVVGVRPPV